MKMFFYTAKTRHKRHSDWRWDYKLAIGLFPLYNDSVVATWKFLEFESLMLLESSQNFMEEI